MSWSQIISLQRNFRDPGSPVFCAQKTWLRLAQVRKNPKQFGFFVLCACQDSNLGPHQYQ